MNIELMYVRGEHNAHLTYFTPPARRPVAVSLFMYDVSVVPTVTGEHQVEWLACAIGVLRRRGCPCVSWMITS